MKPFTLRCYIILAVFSYSLGCQSLFDEPGSKGQKVVKDITPKARATDASPRQRLLILPFLDASESRPQSLREKAREEFIKEIIKRQSAIVIDSDDLKTDFSKFVANGEYQTAEIVKQANQLGVPAVMEGKILDIKVKGSADEVGLFKTVKTRFDAKIRVRILVARSGKEILNTTKNVTLEDSGVRVGQNASVEKLLQTDPSLVEKLVTDAFLDFIPQILTGLEKLNWEGRIAMINGDRIFLNVGRLSGLQVGDILKVSDTGEEVYDPQTGSFIGSVPGRVKGTLEVVNYFGKDGAVAVIHSGGNFKENDKVELY